MGKEIKVEIYGAGCDKFFRTADSFRKVLQKSHMEATVEEITDRKRIACRGSLNLPAVFVNGKLLVQGEGVSEEKAEELLRRAV